MGNVSAYRAGHTLSALRSISARLVQDIRAATGIMFMADVRSDAWTDKEGTAT